MKLPRDQLTTLLNALYDLDETRVPIRHPSDDVDVIAEFELSTPSASTVHFRLDGEAYARARDEVRRQYGTTPADDLPERQSYVNAYLAGGVLEPANLSAIHDFLETNGNRDLNAGHRPVVVGFDTNLLPWRIAHVLDVGPQQSTDDQLPVINGYALATGVRDELDWDYKIQDTEPLQTAFGDEFDRVWNQPGGANREGRLGLTHYRALRDTRYADEITSGDGDEAIVDGYDTYQQEGRKDVLLLSNDRNFVERSKSHRIPAQRVVFPDSLPRKTTGSWTELADTLYALTILFGVLKLPKVTLYGVWNGKTGRDWHEERLEIDCRSPQAERRLKRDTNIIGAFRG